MPLARFYVDADLVPDEETPLPPEVAHHAVRVLRLREGAAITVFNGRGGEFSGHLRIEGARAWAMPEHFDPIERESPLAVTLVQAWVATDKLEWIVEKAVELGVAALILVPTVRSVVQLDEPRRARRLWRLQELIIAACCQSGRNRIPGIRAAITLQQGLELALADGSRGVLLDPHSGESAADPLAGVDRIALAVGPEGGLDERERALATSLDFRPMRLGPRILRTETAGLAGLTALQVLAGDLR